MRPPQWENHRLTNMAFAVMLALLAIISSVESSTGLSR